MINTTQNNETQTQQEQEITEQDTEQIRQEALHYYKQEPSQELKEFFKTAQPTTDLLFKQQETKREIERQDTERAKEQMFKTEKLLSKKQAHNQTTIKDNEPSHSLTLPITNSIKPSITEIERFLIFLNDRFNLGLNFSDITILISESRANIKGYYSLKGKFENTTQKLRAIVLNPIHLKNEPYETITHELAHFYNDFLGVKDCSSNQYHNKHFKKVAEMLLLEVNKTNRGYSETKPTQAFKEMLEQEFKPNKNAFHISQNTTDNKKKPSRLLKFICDCGMIIRASKNESQPLRAICLYCDTQFKQDDKEVLL